MSKNSEYLERHGWVRDSRKKMGCMVIERWYKPPSVDTYSQQTAIEIERQSQKVKSGK